MTCQSDPLNQDGKSYTPAILILVIFGCAILLIFTYLILANNSYSGEIIGTTSFVATLFAIYFAYEASQKIFKKLEDIWALDKTKNVESEFQVKLTNKEYKNNVNKHLILSKVVECVLDNFGVPYAAEYRISIKGSIIRPDFVIFVENKRIPIELKVFPKRIVLPISKDRIEKIKIQMKRYMDVLLVSESILIIWNPEITLKAQEKLERVDNKMIYLINNDKIEEIEKKFANLLMLHKI